MSDPGRTHSLGDQCPGGHYTGTAADLIVWFREANASPAWATFMAGVGEALVAEAEGVRFRTLEEIDDDLH